MTHAGRRCNSTGEGVFYNVDPTLTIDQGKVDANVRQKPLRFATQEFINRHENPCDLSLRDVRGRKVMGAALLDFDKDHNVTLPANKVNFPGTAAPVAGADLNP
jgi:hypothetical protein